MHKRASGCYVSMILIALAFLLRHWEVRWWHLERRMIPHRIRIGEEYEVAQVEHTHNCCDIQWWPTAT